MDPISENDFDAALSVLERPDMLAFFQQLFNRTSIDPELGDIELPDGLSIEEARAIFAAVNRLNAVRSPFPDSAGLVYWYSMPMAVTSSLTMIDRECTNESELGTVIREREGRRILSESLIDEAVAISRFDGVPISAEHGRAFLKSGRVPSDVNERAIWNIYGVLGELPQYANVPFSKQLLLDLYDRITTGIPRAAFDGSARLAGGNQTAEDVLLGLVDFVCAPASAHREHPVIGALLVLWSMTYWRPFPQYSGAVGRAASKLLALSRGYPVLAYLPIWSMVSQLNEGLLPYGGPVETLERGHLARLPEVDMTAYISLHLDVIVQAIQRTREELERTRQRDATMQLLLQYDPDLNRRQREILDKCLRAPETKFRIRAHQRTYAVVYSTARSDLLELEEKGYLRRVLEGKAFSFIAEDDLPERIDRCSVPGRRS